jgi:hypothetical protein
MLIYLSFKPESQKAAAKTHKQIREFRTTICQCPKPNPPLLQEPLQRRSYLFGAPVSGKVHTAALIIVSALVEHARLKMLAQKRDSKVIESGTDGNNLLHDVAAGAVVIHHALNACDLTGDPGEAALRVGLEFSGHDLSYDDATFHGSNR